MHKYNFKFISTEYHNIVFYKMIEYNYVYVYVQNIIYTLQNSHEIKWIKEFIKNILNKW